MPNPAFQNVDKDALNLTHAIALQESGSGGKPNYNAVGDNGTSHGAYQWQPGNYEAAAKEAGFDPTDRAPATQDKVAYYQVKKYKDKGLDPGQIASLWNSGSPDNWKDHSGTTMINGKPIHYDTPKYVEGVKKHYQEIVAARGGSVAAPADVPEPAPKKDLLDTASDVLNTFFPAKNIGNVIGTQIAKFRATPEERKYIKDDATLEGVVGDVAQNALYFSPVGRLAGAGEKAVAAVAPKLAGGVAKTAGNLAAGAGTGYALDVANSASNNDLSFKPGLGTALGVAAPLIAPTLRGAGKLAAQGLGVSTGTGANVIKDAAKAATEGGESRQAFKEALRGKTSPEAIVTDAKSALKQLNNARSDAYNAGIEKIEKETFVTKAGKTYVKRFDPELGKTLFVPTNLTTKGVKDVATRTLKSIGLDAKGRKIDFSKRPSLDSRNIQKVHDFVYNWDDLTPIGLNQLRQEVAGFRKGGIKLSASDSRYNTYIDNLTDNLRTYVGEKVPQIGEMNKAYATASKTISDIKQGLSLGNTTQSDTAFRKLTSVLRTNNEFRAQLLSQLEDEASRNLPEKIAGQQLSEILPRGIMRQISGAGAIGGVLTGVGLVPLMKAAIFTSPRVVGELLLALGFTMRNANTFGKALGANGLLFPAVGAVNAGDSQ